MDRIKITASPDSDRLLHPHLVCTHKLLVCLMTAPYCPNKCWKIWAGKWRGTIYLRRDKSYRSKKHTDDPKFGFWGYKFQQHVLSESPNEAPDTTEPVVLNEEFRCVYQYSLANISVLFSSAKKAVVAKEVLTDPLPLDKLAFIDVRTRRIIQHAGHERSMKKHQFLEWWAGAFLTNDNEVLCAFRDDEGIVNELITYDRNDLVTESMDYWDPDECIKSCEYILSLISETVHDDCDQTMYAFTRSENASYQNIDITEEPASEENCIAPEWYKKAMN